MALWCGLGNGVFPLKLFVVSKPIISDSELTHTISRSTQLWLQNIWKMSGNMAVISPLWNSHFNWEWCKILLQKEKNHMIIQNMHKLV